MRWLAAVAAAATLVAALPNTGLALGGLSAAAVVDLAKRGGSVFTPASVDPEIADLVARRGLSGRLDRFTPAGAATGQGRTVTVAVRVDGEQTRFAVPAAGRATVSGASDKLAGLRISPTRYNLGLSRGYQNFARSTAPVLSRTLSDASIPNLADYRPSDDAADGESRFAARIAGDDNARIAAPARSSESRADQTLDVAGSYRLTRNLDVTAGLRYSQQEDRLAPSRSAANTDSQAVYIGTQFRF